MDGEFCYIACDLGAGSGRVILGRLQDGRFSLSEVHRFISEPVHLRGTLRWDVVQIFSELKIGLRKVAKLGRPVASLSVDSWGVDYALLNAHEPLLSLPYHYRDARTDATFAAATGAPGGPERIFGATGIQLMAINTLYQLIAENERNRPLLEAADRFLTIADYVHFLFCGTGKVEESLASTTQLYDARTRGWSAALIETFGVPAHIFPEIVPSGTRLGALDAEIRKEAGLPEVEVIATCSHDTGAAVAAVPAESGSDDWAYLSSGTWSLIGVELSAPLINDEVRALNYTNEAGYGGTTRFLKNIIGLWLLQESQRIWQRQGQEYDYDELNRLAAQAEPLRSLVNPNAARFNKPGDMPARIAAYCRESGQPEPETAGEFARCILESLALMYRQRLGELEQLTGRPIRRLHIVGGGSKSALLNQWAADATGRTVLAGPVEATALGNIAIQAITLGHLPSLAAAREVIRTSFAVSEFHPHQNSQWCEAAERLARINPDL